MNSNNYFQEDDIDLYDDDDNIEASYKFKEHLLKLSKSKSLNRAIKEWVIVSQGKSTYKNNVCICQHKIKNYTLMINPITKHAMYVGDTCSKKFKKNKTGNYCCNDELQNKVNDIFSNGNLGYEIIDDILVYSNEIVIGLTAWTAKQSNKAKNIDDLYKLHYDLIDLIENKYMGFLESELKKIDALINQMVEEAKEKKQKEKDRQERIEYEIKERIRIYDEEQLEIKAKEQRQRIEYQRLYDEQQKIKIENNRLIEEEKQKQKLLLEIKNHRIKKLENIKRKEMDIIVDKIILENNLLHQAKKQKQELKYKK